MSGVTGDFAKLKDFTSRLKSMPKVVGIAIAAAAAPAISGLSKGTFDASQNAYGDPWAPGKKGQKITLRKSGALERYAGTYAAIGERIRAVLGVPYAIYQIGKRPVLPRGGLPIAYVAALSRVAGEKIKAHLGGGS